MVVGPGKLLKQSAQSTGKNRKIKLSFFNFCLFVVVWGLNFHSSQISSFPSRDVIRQNLGVNFKFVKRVQITTAIHIHHFGIQIPNEVLEESHQPIIYNREDLCLMWHDELLYGKNNNITWTAANAPNINSLCRDTDVVKHIHALLRLMKHKHRLIINLEKTIKDTIPLSVSLPDSKRSLLPFVGDLASTLFGVGTSKDINRVGEEVQRLGVALKNQANLVKKTVNHLSTFTKQVDSRLSLLGEALMNNSLAQTANLNLAISSVVGKVERRIGFAENLLRINAVLDGMEQYLQAYLGAVAQLANGRLSAFFVSSSDLRKVLEDLEKTNKLSKVIYREPRYYYNHGTVYFSRVENHLIISLQIPMTNFETHFNIYDLIKIPLALPNHNKSLTEIVGIPKTVAIQMNQQYFAELSELDRVFVEIKGVLHTENRLIQKFHSNTCLGALFLDETESVKQACKYEILVSPVEPHIFPISDNQFIFNQIVKYEIKCEGHEVQEKLGCKFCLVEIPENCLLKTDAFQLFPLQKRPEIKIRLPPIF